MVAVVLSIAILLAFNFFYEKPRVEELKRQQEIAAAMEEDAAVPGMEVAASGATWTDGLRICRTPSIGRCN